MLVTIPEETPVNEMIETSFAIEEDLGVHLGPAVVNSVLPDLDDLDHDLATLAAGGLDLTDNERTRSPPPLISVPVDSVSSANSSTGSVPCSRSIRSACHRFGSSIGPGEIAELASILTAAIEALPRRATSDGLRRLLAESQVVICCGTGGVGKTTTSAATALAAAAAGRRACVVTIDPAKRLADSLGIGELSNTPTVIDGPWDGTLAALMLDTESTFDEVVVGTPRRRASRSHPRQPLLQERQRHPLGHPGLHGGRNSRNSPAAGSGISSSSTRRPLATPSRSSRHRSSSPDCSTIRSTRSSPPPTRG